MPSHLAKRILGFCSLVAIASLPLRSGTWNAFGPKTYTRGTGAPVTVTDTFSILNPATQFTLHVVNGALLNDENEVGPSGFVIIKGVTFIGSYNFNLNVSVIDIGAHLCRFVAFSA
jgi:hypothetical protein